MRSISSKNPVPGVHLGLLDRLQPVDRFVIQLGDVSHPRVLVVCEGWVKGTVTSPFCASLPDGGQRMFGIFFTRCSRNGACIHPHPVQTGL